MTDLTIVRRVSYGTWSGGVQAGTLGFTLEVSGLLPMRSGEVADLLNLLRIYPQGGARQVLLRGELVPSGLTEEMFTLLKGLRDTGYQIAYESNGQVWYPWFALLNWLTVRTGSEKWAGFECNEFVYRLIDPTLPVPMLPPKKDKTFLYLQPVSPVDTTQVMNFVRGSADPWRLWIGVRAIQEILYPTPGGEDR